MRATGFAVLAASVLTLAAAPARAGMFDDDVARVPQLAAGRRHWRLIQPERPGQVRNRDRAGGLGESPQYVVLGLWQFHLSASAAGLRLFVDTCVSQARGGLKGDMLDHNDYH